MKKEDITKDILIKLFNYDPLTGDLTWNNRDISEFKNRQGWISFNRKKAGTVINGTMENGHGKKYYRVKVLGLQQQVHRIIWVMVHGEWPEFIDHINGNGLDNRLVNIRSVSVTENNRNLRMNKLNTSGHMGVGKLNDRWQAHIWINNTQLNIGIYDTKEEAVAARKAAEKIEKYHKNHGQIRGL